MNGDHVSLGRKLQGLLAAGPVAMVTVIVLFSLVNFVSYNLFAPSAGFEGLAEIFEWRNLRSLVSELGIVVAFGLPIATTVTMALGLPLWVAAERLGLRSRGQVARLGALAGLIVFLIPFLLRLPGAFERPPEGSSSSFGYWGVTMEVDGWPTPIGWAVRSASALAIILAGIIVGLTAHAVATRNRPPR